MTTLREKIDDFLPEFDMAAEYGIAIHTPAHVVYEGLLRADFSQSQLIQILQCWLLRQG